MIDEWELKKLFVEIGRRMWQRNYVAANDGNLSVRLNENEILTTPTGVSKGFMTTEMILKVDYEGKVISRNNKFQPSSELKMHTAVYNERPDINSVVHAHPPYATSFAVAGIPLDKCVLPEAIVTLGAVPIAKYGLPSTNELPDSIRPHIKNSDVILLENHGAIAVGKDLLNAYYKLETLEHSANIIWNAMQLGPINVFNENERDRLLNLREKYKVTSRILKCEPNNQDKQSNENCDKPTSNILDEDKIKEITKKVIDKLNL